MRLLLTVLICMFGVFTNAQNLVKNGSFENQKLYENNQLARIGGFGDLGETTQTSNPKLEKADKVKEGIWYKKASNSGYIRAVVTDSDSTDGDHSLLLSINRNSPQANLDKWETTAVLQYLPIEKEDTYILTFYAKNNIDCNHLFAGLITGNGSVIKGSKWVDIDNTWRKYSIEIEPSSHETSGGYTKKMLSRGAVVIGIGCEYDENGRSKQASVLIDKIEITKK